MTVSEITRRNLFQIFKTEGISWSGRLDNVDFLSRLYDLDRLPSHDSRYASAKDDILTHTVSFPGDWPEDWVFDDDRFNLRHCPETEFLLFACETVHPVIRPDREEAAKLVEEFNRYLADEGYRVEQVQTKFGNIRYEAKGLLSKTIEALEQIKDQAQELKAEHIEREIVRMTSSIERDPELAIGSAKDFVESICKTVLKEKAKPLKGNEDLPKLVRLTMEDLNLPGLGLSDKKVNKIIDKMVGCPSTLVDCIAEFRNLQGTGHGKDQKVTVEPRYAALAVNSAATLAQFLISDWTVKARKITPGS